MPIHRRAGRRLGRAVRQRCTSVHRLGAAIATCSAPSNRISLKFDALRRQHVLNFPLPQKSLRAGRRRRHQRQPRPTAALAADRPPQSPPRRPTAPPTTAARPARAASRRSRPLAPQTSMRATATIASATRCNDICFILCASAPLRETLFQESDLSKPPQIRHDLHDLVARLHDLRIELERSLRRDQDRSVRSPARRSTLPKILAECCRSPACPGCRLLRRPTHRSSDTGCRRASAARPD